MGRAAKDLLSQRAQDLVYGHKEMAVMPDGRLYLLTRQTDLQGLMVK